MRLLNELRLMRCIGGAVQVILHQNERGFSLVRGIKSLLLYGSIETTFSRKTNKIVKARNAKVKNPDYILQPFEQYSEGLECTHAGKHKYRGPGERLRQESRRIESCTG
ncbi:hypothetical protein V7S43_013716 [Phytophthora oleae]|uniref:Uncharacterized protein n=1 Tax=Phytophthora oleae TaxID=2107226 RepID=A0ABD3F3P7_9STRA